MAYIRDLTINVFVFPFWASVVACSPEPEEDEDHGDLYAFINSQLKNIQPYHIKFQCHFQNNFYENSHYSSDSVDINNEI